VAALFQVGPALNKTIPLPHILWDNTDFVIHFNKILINLLFIRVSVCMHNFQIYFIEVF